MKKVFLPTDYSSASTNAIKYAFAFCSDLFKEEIEYILFHTYQSPITPGISHEHVFSEEDLLKVDAEKKLFELHDQFHEAFPDLNLRSKIAYGFASNVIVENAFDESADLIVVGSKSRNSFERLLQGSKLNSIAHQAHCPVLIVPNNYTHSKADKILFATDFKNIEDLTILDLLQKLVNVSGPEIKTLYVYGENGLNKEQYEEESIKVKNYVHSEKYSHFFLEHNRPASGIEEFVTGYNADLLVLVHRERGVFETLFHKSVIKQMIEQVNIPILVLHKTEKKVPDKPFKEKVQHQIHAWKSDFDDLKVQAHLGKIEAGEKWDEGKEEAKATLEKIKEKLENVEDIAEDKWDYFKEEMKEALSHIKKAFSGK